jgi:hypothetical protein
LPDNVASARANDALRLAGTGKIEGTNADVGKPVAGMERREVVGEICVKPASVTVKTNARATLKTR